MKYKLLKAMAEKAAVKRETLTPPDSVESNPPGFAENGYPSNSSDESGSEATCDEAPLDFSVHKRSDSADDLGSDGSGESHSRNCESGHQSTAPHTPPQNLSRTKTTEVSPTTQDGKNFGVKPEDLVGKIGEPQLAVPFGAPGAVFPGLGAFPPGFNAAAAAAVGIIPNAAGLLGALPFASGVVDNSNKKTQNNSKPTRPFKAYPKDPLSLPLGYYGIPGMLPGITLPNTDPSSAQAVSSSAEELFSQYRALLMNQEKNGKGLGTKGSKNGVVSGSSENDVEMKSAAESPVSPNSTTGSNASLSPQANALVSPQPPLSNTSGQPNHGVQPSAVPPPGPFTSPSSEVLTKFPSKSQTSTPRKKAKLLPDDKKDAAYWERRRKNNDAAKRSRDARRAKEDEIAIRAAFLEQENLKLRVEVAALKNETAKLRCMLYNS